MARYFFDVTDDEGIHRDDVGDECADLDDARDQCQGLLADTGRENARTGKPHTVTCDVRDETGRIVYRGKWTYEETYEGTCDPFPPPDERSGG